MYERDWRSKSFCCDHHSHIGVMMSSHRAEGWVLRGRSRDEKQEYRLRESGKRLHVRQMIVKEGVRYSNADSILVFKK